MGYNDWDDDWEDEVFSAYGIDDIDDIEEEDDMHIFDNEFVDNSDYDEEE